ncbi:MAG: hypothetical protein ABEI53_03265 [Candidatus Magasanikbacteria bacterium]
MIETLKGIGIGTIIFTLIALSLTAFIGTNRWSITKNSQHIKKNGKRITNNWKRIKKNSRKINKKASKSDLKETKEKLGAKADTSALSATKDSLKILKTSLKNLNKEMKNEMRKIKLMLKSLKHKHTKKITRLDRRVGDNKAKIDSLELELLGISSKVNDKFAREIKWLKQKHYGSLKKRWPELDSLSLVCCKP